MLHTLPSLLAPAVMERVTLVINHVLSAENIAREKLLPHVGRSIELAAAGWPSLLPALPPCVFRVTPAGLLEWCGAERPETIDLALHVDASNPALVLVKGLAGERPAVTIDGDAQLAADVSWLMENLRWDVAADLEKIVGPVVAQQLQQAGRALSAALRAALDGASRMRERLRPRA